MPRHPASTRPQRQLPDQAGPRPPRRGPTPGRRRPTAGRAEHQAGGSTLFAVILMVSLLVIVGLVVDGGAMLTAHQKADSIARQAARTAGQHVTVDPAGHRLTIEPGAVAAGRAYARDHGCEQTDVRISGHTITATCALRYDPVFLPGTYLATRTAYSDAQTVVEP